MECTGCGLGASEVELPPRVLMQFTAAVERAHACLGSRA